LHQRQKQKILFIFVGLQCKVEKFEHRPFKETVASCQGCKCNGSRKQQDTPSHKNPILQVLLSSWPIGTSSKNKIKVLHVIQ
jgi:hypothetical protein